MTPLLLANSHNGPIPSHQALDDEARSRKTGERACLFVCQKIDPPPLTDSPVRNGVPGFAIRFQDSIPDSGISPVLLRQCEQWRPD
jgi:hypothetical protein